MLVQLDVTTLKQLIREVIREELCQKHLPPPENYTVKEAAARIRCCERHVRRLIAEGRLRADHVGSRVLIPRYALDDLLAGAA